MFIRIAKKRNPPARTRNGHENISLAVFIPDISYTVRPLISGASGI